MKKRRIDPKKIILGLMARGCPDCFSVQHVWFASIEEFDNWDCPVCEGRIEPHEDYIKRPEAESTEGNEEAQSEEVPLVSEDSEDEPDEPESTV